MKLFSSQFQEKITSQLSELLGNDPGQNFNCQKPGLDIRYLCINISLKFGPDKKPQMKKMEAEPLIIQDAERFEGIEPACDRFPL